MSRPPLDGFRWIDEAARYAAQEQTRDLWRYPPFPPNRVVDTHVVLRTLVNGGPGTYIVDGRVNVGQQFFVELLVQENDAACYGVAGYAVNITWDAAILSEIDNPFSLAKIITPKLPAFRSGKLEPGRITNLAAGCFLAGRQGWPIGNLGPQVFATLKFQAKAPGSTVFELHEGKSSITQQPTTSLNEPQTLWFERKLVTVR